jgi:hypothetical protein
MFLAPSVITSRRDRLSRDEKDEHDRCLSILSRAGSITQFGCVYVIERVGSPEYYKAGLTSLDNVDTRMGNLQTGDPNPQRLVSLCMFYSREVAAIVERGLKTDYRRRVCMLKAAPNGTAFRAIRSSPIFVEYHTSSRSNKSWPMPTVAGSTS